MVHATISPRLTKQVRRGLEVVLVDTAPAVPTWIFDFPATPHVVHDLCRRCHQIQHNFHFPSSSTFRLEQPGTNSGSWGSDSLLRLQEGHKPSKGESYKGTCEVTDLYHRSSRSGNVSNYFTIDQLGGKYPKYIVTKESVPRWGAEGRVDARKWRKITFGPRWRNGWCCHPVFCSSLPSLKCNHCLLWGEACQLIPAAKIWC